MLDIILDKKIKKVIELLPLKHQKQLKEKILSLRSNPQPHDSKKLVDYQLFRCDSGEYRIIYDFDNTKVYIYLIGKRNDSEVYKILKRNF